MVVTNLVVALQIISTEMVPCPCPDNDPGCCVMHRKEVKTIRYELPKIDPGCLSSEDNSMRIGIAMDGFGTPAVWKANVKGIEDQLKWTGCDQCLHIPIKAFKYCPECDQKIFSDNIIGLLNVRLIGEAVKDIDRQCHHKISK